MWGHRERDPVVLVHRGCSDNATAEPGGVNNRNLLSWGFGGPRFRIQGLAGLSCPQEPLGKLSPAPPRAAGSPAPRLVAHLCIQGHWAPPSEPLSLGLSSSHEDTSRVGCGACLLHYDPTLTHYTCSDPIPKEGHILRFRGGHALWRDTTQPGPRIKVAGQGISCLSTVLAELPLPPGSPHDLPKPR